MLQLMILCVVLDLIGVWLVLELPGVSLGVFPLVIHTVLIIGT